MSSDRFASAHEMVREYQELEQLMADPSIHEDQGKARQLGRRYAQLGPVVAGFNEWKAAADDLEAAKEMALEDPDFASEQSASSRMCRSQMRSATLCWRLLTFGSGWR